MYVVLIVVCPLLPPITTINLNRLTEIDGLPCNTTDIPTETPVIPEETPVSTIACNNFAAGTPFCNEGVLPTCSFTQEQKSQIAVGMTYEEVVNIVGCHGFLASRDDLNAAYSWVEGTNVTFIGFTLDGSIPRVKTIV